MWKGESTMWIHQPFLLTINHTASDTETVVVKGYELGFWAERLTEQLYKNEIVSYFWIRLELPVLNKTGDYVSGFLIWPIQQEVTGVDNKGYYAVDLRVNEGMCFSGKTKQELTDTIVSYLHSCAIDYQREMERKAAQEARKKV